MTSYSQAARRRPNHTSQQAAGGKKPSSRSKGERFHASHRSVDAAHEDTTTAGRADRPIRWAFRESRAVISCRNDTNVITVTDEDGTSVYVHQPGVTNFGFTYRTRSARTYPNWQTAREVAEGIARKIGVDGYSFHGLWRSLPPTSDQLKALRNWGMPIPPKLTRGQAADLLSLTVAESIDPFAVTEKWDFR